MNTDAIMLASHAYFCRSGDQLVFLDLKQNRYFSVRAAERPDFRDLSLQNAARCTEESTSQQQTDPLVRELIARQILTVDRNRGRDPLATCAAPPGIGLLCEDPRTPPELRSKYAGNFLLASVCAAWLLQRRSLLQIVDRIRRRRSRRGFVPPFDVERARELVSAFDALRPFLFTAQDRCLYHSLALIEFLSRYQLYPEWVFGVRTEPFRAHCWVQQASIVLNDYAERVRGFTPIMVV